MLPQLYLYSTFATNGFIFIFAVIYLWRLYKKEKIIEKKEQLSDSNYHHVVEEALSKERQILDDATKEADQILTGAQYLTRNSKEEVTQAIKHIVADIQNEAADITKSFTNQYVSSLQEVTTNSLKQVHEVMAQLKTDLQQQITTFNQSLLPEVEKELEAYKHARLQEIDKVVLQIVQHASQEILNKSLSLNDHKELVIQALEKAKNEGVFD